MFDDTIGHGAWNDSDTARAVLILDVRHPLIPDGEHAAIMAAMDAFTGVATGPGTGLGTSTATERSLPR